MKKILTILTLSAGLLAFPGTALADRDRAGADNSASNQSYEKHSLKADRNHQRKDNYRVKKHADKKYLHKKYQHKNYAHKKYHAETIRQHKLARKHQDRVAAYRHFNGSKYSYWRDRRDYKRHLSYSERHGYRELRKHYYGHNHDRYRTHYLRYHQGHKRSHHQHDDSYLEWVTTMLLLNELLDDDYR